MAQHEESLQRAGERDAAGGGYPPEPQRPPGEPITDEVLPEAWGSFLDGFSQLNRERETRVELIASPEAGTLVLTEDRPLLGVTLDREAGDVQVVVECGDTAGREPTSIRHVVNNPVAISARRSASESWDALQIVSREEGSVVVTINPHPGRRSAAGEAADARGRPPGG